MTKSEFLDRLAQRLDALPRLEVEKTVAYYSEIIDDRCEDGMTEAEAVDSLEDVETIARQIICDTPLPVLVKERMRKPRPALTPLIIVLLVLGAPLWLPLLITAASVVLTLFVVLWTVVVCLFVTVLAVGASGIVALVAGPLMFAGDLARGIFLAGAGLICLGLAVFAFFGAAAAAKQCARFVRWLGRRFKRRFVRKEVNQ